MREPTVATMGTASLTERQARALGQAPAPARERMSPTTARPQGVGSHGIAPETAARSGRRSFLPPWPLSIGSRIVS